MVAGSLSACLLVEDACSLYHDVFALGKASGTPYHYSHSHGKIFYVSFISQNSRCSSDLRLQDEEGHIESKVKFCPTEVSR